MQKSESMAPLPVLVAWTMLILMANYMVVDSAWRQDAAAGFPTVTGRVLHSEIAHGSFLRRGFVVRYSYQVGRRHFIGGRYRYDDQHLAIRWQPLLQSYPAGSQRAVYYNPSDPADSLLSPGLCGGDVLVLLFLLPVNIVTCGIWLEMISRLAGAWRKPEAGAVKIVQRNGRVRARLAEFSPLAAGFYGIAAAAFAASIWATFAYGFDPPLHNIARLWIVVGLAGAFVFFWKFIVELSGRDDLVIDARTRTVIVPQTAGRRAPVPCALADIAGVALRRRVSRTVSGAYDTYVPVLQRLRSLPEVHLITWGWSQAKARGFGEWLGRQLGVNFNGVLEEKDEPAAGAASNK